MNVLNAQSINEYRDIVEKLVKDDQVKGIIIASAKEAFIAGADRLLLIFQLYHDTHLQIEHLKHS
jgi:3-hydroxyacyl-CoA dehydrogenase/enoyl-CoA hydratase/3-hydroxybutyryl-CoA epimerase